MRAILLALLSLALSSIRVAMAQDNSDKTDEARAIQKIESLGGKVTQHSPDTIITLELRDGSVMQVSGDWLGLDDSVSFEKCPEADNRFGDGDIALLKSIKKLKRVDLKNTHVTDAGLKDLSQFQELTYLDLRGTQITNAGLKELATMENLVMLGLGDTQISDAGLQEISSLKNLTILNLHATQITDAGMNDLTRLRNLAKLDLSQTKITDTGIKILAGPIEASKATVGKIGQEMYDRLTGLEFLSEPNLSGIRMTEVAEYDREMLTLLTDFQRFSELWTTVPRHSRVLRMSKLLGGIPRSNAHEIDQETPRRHTELKALSDLNVSETQMTNEGLRALHTFPLATLNIRGTRVTDLAVERWERERVHQLYGDDIDFIGPTSLQTDRALPNLQIIR